MVSAGTSWPEREQGGSGSRFTADETGVPGARSGRAAPQTISIVIPAFNEQECLEQLHDRLHRSLARIGLRYELIFVDDGSSDNTEKVIRRLSERDQRVIGLHFSRNFGHEAASTAGLDCASGDVIVLMDADLQDPPELIEELLAKWREGYDVVYAQRRRRAGETIFKRVTAWLFYRSLNRLTQLPIPADTGDFRLLDRRVVNEFRRLREHNRFVRGLIAWLGYRQCAVLFDRPGRQAGEAKYNVRKLVRLAADAVFSFSDRPLRLATYGGILLTVSGLGMVSIGSLRWLMGINQPAFVLMSFITLLSGIQFLTLGVLGEYVARIHRQAQSRPLYVIARRSGGGRRAGERAGDREGVAGDAVAALEAVETSA